MKTKIIALAAIVASLTFANAADKIKAPNGGRIISTVTPHAEAFRRIVPYALPPLPPSG